ncbi:MAG: DUF2225 domain-containing protein [Spirochaetales bacterium]|jgi:uncharacterized protein (DUF2225 family)|uniref:DUF2225 domain-containing protein n=1 Tax=Treponema berlinense TaxID=225004 RepID=A0A1T4KEK7_9SPIR|nr:MULTISPECIES: DUF2225 domain-containing protein [Treponema]MDO5766899.1 DUF2225 domain-containing protein [Spirochaetales bacterium]MBQ9103244.1 DUF2225 domain-containing protein [Treponema sp.]MCI5541527.1 DUF2225 domain-containing protein [Treponema berlinense]MDD5834127.1 DUF2225 domain-containing protein [Treponema berlinense]MDY3707784.1 DUF2225 domain-containing protein [Treponema berlinense]
MLYRSSKKVENPGKKPKISYWSKNRCHCPVCQNNFEREEMLSGSGRMIAGELTDELHRVFEPSAKYGQIYPVIYSIGACPKCHTALFWSDFEEIQDNNSLNALLADSKNRKEIVNNMFPYYELTRERNLLDGAAMYYLALLSYEKVDLSYAPTMKRAIISLRLAWICRDLQKIVPEHNYDYAAEVFYRKAQFFYEQTLINETQRIETIAKITNFGPDIDKNYGYDGVIYLNSLLEYKYGQKEDMQMRYKKLDANKRSIARIFGLGKSSKSKPGPLLEKSRDLYDKLTATLNEANVISVDDE